MEAILTLPEFNLPEPKPFAVGDLCVNFGQPCRIIAPYVDAWGDEHPGQWIVQATGAFGYRGKWVAPEKNLQRTM